MIKSKDIINYMEDNGIPYITNLTGEEIIEGYSALNNYKIGTLTWVKKQENINYLPENVALVITEKDIDIKDTCYIKVENSKKLFFSIIERFFGGFYMPPKCGQGTYLGPSVKLGENVRIGFNCSIDGDITIGDNTIIYNNVSIIGKVSIGSKCVIQSGVVIGDEGYSYTEDSDHVKTMNRQFGGVTIGDDVLIGANSVVQNGAIDDTYIGDGCKISGASFISHNVRLGKNSAVIVSVMHGSSSAEENAYIVSSTVRNQKSIGKNAFVGLGSVVINDIPDDQIVVGSPAKPFKKE